MELTPFEKLVVETADYLDSIGLDFILDGSCLLGAIREGRCLEWDKEVNFSILGSDINEELIEKFKRDFPSVRINKCHEKCGGIYLLKENTPDIWQSEKGVIFLSPIWVKHGICYFNILDNYCHVYPSEFADKSKWEIIDFLGRKFKVPPDPKRMLTVYFGDDWMIPKKNWQWNWESKNLKTYEGLFSKVIYTGGTFDMFHYGHVNFLKQCSEYGLVVVGLNRDDFVQAKKGRIPVMDYESRKKVLESCKYVYKVIESGGYNQKVNLMDLRPDYFAIGSDWKEKNYLEQAGCTEGWLEENNIKFTYIPYTDGVSTTSIIRKVKNGEY